MTPTGADDRLRSIIRTQTEIAGSFGVAADAEPDVEALVAAADRALRTAKDRLYGRNA